jgi:hypothetical protein
VDFLAREKEEKERETEEKTGMPSMILLANRYMENMGNIIPGEKNIKQASQKVSFVN